ncbi:CCA tRNA nucleotidyltransferase [Ornithinibacillus scapharcae]|uniref:CCA tRNA nucleotidyltransferase n=1 Tax=Ornithinibacillus scapharcae TaxID=1147159 RepID=UPI000225BA22|nr:CCA tRNA nucleotidyltransferase [Ornithinibacillus scapharcae]
MQSLSKPFQEALHVIETIEKSGHQAYFVGGCVRDLLLEREVGDIDITTSAKPYEIQAIFDEVIPVGIEHGTVIVRHNHVSYEVTTFRVEGKYSDNRHPDSVAFIDKIEEDLARRDFTINALAMDKTGKIIDLFNGTSDLHDKIIRTVGNGKERLKEDPLRILRAIRFSSQLGFEIDSNTLEAIILVKPWIEELAVERITVELQKLFGGKNVVPALNYMVDLGIEQHLPVFNKYHVLPKLINKIKPLSSLSELICLIHQLEPDAELKQIAKELKCSNKTLKEALKLNEAIEYYQVNGVDNWLVYLLLPNFHDSFIRLALILSTSNIDYKDLKERIDFLVITSKKDLEIDGNDIIEIFPTIRKGPWIQDIISKIEKQVVQGKIENKKSILKDWIRWNPPEVE